jgi:hypothetical protein
MPDRAGTRGLGPDPPEGPLSHSDACHPLSSPVLPDIVVALDHAAPARGVNARVFSDSARRVDQPTQFT